MAHASRARSANRVNDRLTDLLERLAMINGTNQPCSEYKTPIFDGKGDVDCLALRFMEVSTAEWKEGATVLHLKESMKDEAQDGGEATSTPAVFEALRPRYATSQEKKDKGSILLRTR